MADFSKQCSWPSLKFKEQDVQGSSSEMATLASFTKMAPLMSVFTVIISLFVPSNPSGCEMVSGWGFEFHFLND